MPSLLTKSGWRAIALITLMVILDLIGHFISIQAEIALAAMMIICETSDLLERGTDGTQ